MPTPSHPQAKFDPVPPDLDLHTLVERTPNFQWVLRISAAQICNIGPQEFEKLVFLHVIHGGKPLVIEKWNDRLAKSIFSAKWLEETYNKKEEKVRDIVAQTDIPMTMGHYLRSLRQLCNQWTPSNFRDDRRQRLYLKDIDCPPEWQERLAKVIPPNLYYMNENVEERVGRQRSDDFDMFQEEKTAAPAGDLMSSLPEEMRAQNLMCYIGHEGTYTPAHREMCASLGQNIMIDASGDENGEKPGSSIWFMTETKDREVVREYFLSMLGHDIEIEKHFAQINAWKKATFPVYIVEQKVGDFILVPPLAPHQVWNRGTRTIKVAWNRTTVETLDMALHEALPKARIVCRDEQYKNKAIVHFTLEKYYNQIMDMEKNADIGLLGLGQDLIKSSTRMKQMAADFKNLFRLFAEILVDEMFATKEKDVEYVEFDSNITCSYCRANIFNRFLTCKHCVRQLVNGDEDTYDICMECYAMGRSCFCISNLNWCEQWHWADLVDRYEDWRALIIKNDGFIDFDTSPLPLELARKKFGKKSVAQICQEQLRRRPWKDLSKVDQPSEPEPESEPEVDDNGRPKKKKKKKKKRRLKKGDVYRCHVCCHKDYTYKLAFCSTPGCTEAYCYGVLYRAFDQIPQVVMQDERWQCPRCLKNCNCGSCRRAANGSVPYVPKNTLLGHDTRPIADDRSVESLIDFKVHNLAWLKNVGDESRSLSSKRMQKLQQAAEAEKAKGADLAHEVPALPDGELAESMDAAMKESVAHGYGDQSEVLGHPMGEYATNGSAAHDLQQTDEHARVPEADMSVSQDQSSYPDPSILGHERMLGMGYYEQDDSPDKILFDPYQMPTAESLVVEEEPEMMSEYFKKQLRYAKRRARQEEDNDPDFAAPRTHHRKRARLDSGGPRDAQQDALDNMDPALFGGDETMMDVPGDDDDAPANPENGGSAEAEAAQSAEDARAPDEHRPYSPNRPALRHARPKTSYLDPEIGEEEFNDVLIPRSQRPPEGITEFNPENTAKDPLDLASAAIQAITRTADDASEGAKATPASQQKRRGRPPGRPRRSEGDSSRPTTNSGTPQGTGKRRGRPPRSSLAKAISADEDEEDLNLDAQLAQQLDGFDENGEVIDRAEQSPQPGSKRRGRPPRSQAQTQPQTVQVSIELESAPLLSMAERMRLKGKKFKIGQKKRESQAAATSAAENGDKSGSPAATDEAPASNKKEAGAAKKPGRRGRPPAARKEPKSAEEDEDFNPAAEEESISEEDEAAIQIDGDEDPFRDLPAPAANRAESVVVPVSASSPARSPTPAASPTPASPTPASPTPAQSPSPVQSPTPSAAARSPSPPPQPKAPAGPTIVRLMDSEEEDYSESDDESAASAGGDDVSSGSDDSDDEDIPAEPKRRAAAPPAAASSRGTGMAFRGSRGRGGGRGGRGRGRGVARRGMS